MLLYALLLKHMYYAVGLLHSVTILKEFNHTWAQCEKTEGIVPFYREVAQLDTMAHMFLLSALILWQAVLYLPAFYASHKRD
jgi:hypothetical protein